MAEDRHTMANSEKRRAYNVKYASEMKKKYDFRLSKAYDVEYIELMDSISSKPEFIRGALEDYARKNGLPVPKRRTPEND